MSFQKLVKFWIWLCAITTLAGWGLSTIGQLNRVGYAVVFLAAAVALFVSRKQSDWKLPDWSRLCRRFRRPLPLAFLVLTVLIFVGGAIYPPSNYSGLQYRAARALQWLAHDGWWWIHSPNYRMNDRACDYEWMLAPLLLFTKSDRVLFLVNFIPFLLLPGLIYSVFTRLGVRMRVAWRWMWLLPTGYNFLLQAGSLANDVFPAVFLLAAMDFGLRARESRKTSDVWNSILAIALLTGAKASNLPLLLPWAILMFPLLPLLRRKMAVTVLVCLAAAVVSFLPTAVLNWHYCGDWSGAVLEEQGLAMKSPVVGIWGNALLLVFNNFLPPLFPFAGWWNQHALDVLPHFLIAPMIANFEPGFHIVGELPTEDWIGIGFGLSLLLAVSVVAALGHGKTMEEGRSSFLRLVRFAPWLALLAYGAKSGMVTPQRLIAPYYPLLIASLVAGKDHAEIIRRWWWKLLAGLAVLLAFVVLLLSPDRPLWPAKTILAKLSAVHPQQAAVARALKVYTTYAHRFDALGGVRDLLPAEATTIGFIAGPDDMDISLWRPFGRRRVEHFFLTDPPELVRQSVRYAVVGGFNLKSQNLPLEGWLQKSGAELIATTNATLKVSEGPQPWYVVRFKP